MARQHMRALLVPQGELPGELRILINARIYLLGAVDQPRLREIVREQTSVRFAVAPPGDAANHVVAVRRRERKYLSKFEPLLFARQLHQHKVWIDRLLRLLLFVL